MEAVSLPKNLVKKKLPKANLFKVAVFSVFTFLLTAPQPAHAGIADDIANFFIDVLLRATFLFTGLVTTFVAVIVNMFLTVVAFFFKLVLDWAITVALNTSYTSGQVFLSGWPILRDLANMALILILVGIGIGTMLSLRGRSFLDKSRLPMFILVALLINFTPVITGVIIDFTNIVANVFWLAAQNVSSAFISTNVGAQITQDGTRLVDSITNVLSLAADENRFGGIYLSLTVESVASIVLNIVVIFTFTLLTALFLGRTLALMLLVILSPVAFLGLIWGRGAKARNSLWEKWWHNFLQWSIIVIPLLFFMWLGGVFTQANEVICSGNTAFPGAVGDLANNVGVLAESGDRSFVCGAVTMAFAAATMMWGILISFNTSNKTARAVIGKTKQFAQASAKWAGKKGALYTKKVGAPRARDVTRKIANTRVGRNKVLGAPLRSLARTTQKQVDQLQKEIKGYEKDYKNANNFSEIRADLYAEGDRGFAAMRVAADKFTEEFAKEMESSEKLQKNFKTYRTRSSIRQDKLDEDIIRRLPHLIETDKERKKIVGKMSYGDVMKLPSQSLKDPEFMNELMKNESINFNALHDIQRKSDAHRDALFGNEDKDIEGSLHKVRHMHDPNEERTIEEVLDEIDGGKRKNKLKDPILKTPLWAGALKTRGDEIRERRPAGERAMREDLAKQSLKQIQKIEQQEKKLDEEIAKHEGRVSDQGIAVPGRMKEESQKELEKLKEEKRKLQNKKRLYESTAYQRRGRKNKGDNRKGRGRTSGSPRTGDIENQMDSIQNEMESLDEELEDVIEQLRDASDDERGELLDRQSELQSERSRLTNELRDLKNQL